eukprot:1525330-Amphidinium_carterae.1
MQGLPIVSFGERANVWIPTGLPDTWRTYLSPEAAAASVEDAQAVPLQMPAVIAAYADRPADGV